MVIDHWYLFWEFKGGYGSLKTGWSDIPSNSKEPFWIVQNIQ
jgi:hypothetical protein